MTIKSTIIGLASLLAIAFTGGTASAQYRDRGFDGYNNYQTGDWFFDSYGETETFRPGYQLRHETYGRVLAVKTVYVRGSRMPHLAALITTYAHEKIVVDLGPTWRANRLGLRPYGDRLWVTGERVNIRGRNIILARTARTEYRRIAINNGDRRFDMRYRPRQQAIRYRYEYRY
jgi:hypothetical protein